MIRGGILVFFTSDRSCTCQRNNDNQDCQEKNGDVDTGKHFGVGMKLKGFAKDEERCVRS
jgi:hypothetical protein